MHKILGIYELFLSILLDMIDFLINTYVKQLDERNNDELLYIANEALKCSILVLT